MPGRLGMILNKKGNSLIETIAAITILSIALLPMIKLIGEAPWAFKQLEGTEEAARLVQEKLESLSSPGVKLADSEVKTEAVGSYMRKTVFEEKGGSGSRKLLKVSVLVSKEGDTLCQAQTYLITGDGTP